MSKRKNRKRPAISGNDIADEIEFDGPMRKLVRERPDGSEWATLGNREVGGETQNLEAT